jgi:hypothetical protein
MPAADLDALAGEKIAQHARPREWTLQVQFVDTPHERQVLRRDRARPVIHRASADAQSLRLTGDRQVVLPVDHRFALNRPASARALRTKIVLQRQLSDLGVKELQIDRRRRRFRLVASENARRAFEKLTTPLRDLVRMDVKLLRKFGQGLLALDRGQRHLRLEGRRVVPASSFPHLRS